MKRSGSRHFSEEELLMHFLQEETPDVAGRISEHLTECEECHAIFEEYRDLVGRIRAWAVPELPVEAWLSQEKALAALYRADMAAGRRKGILKAVEKSLVKAWNYALENPLPTLAYIAVAVAFALERTITTFRLDRILPGTSQVFEILRQVF